MPPLLSHEFARFATNLRPRQRKRLLRQQGCHSRLWPVKQGGLCRALHGQRAQHTTNTAGWAQSV